MQSVKSTKRSRELLDQVTILFSGDSGDGIQVVGDQYARASWEYGNDIRSLPDYPAEIRAPAGTPGGVSGYQLRFSSDNIHTPGDVVDVMVAMNPSALKQNIAELKNNGILIVNSENFKALDLKKAGYESNPLNDGSLAHVRVVPVEITRLTVEALADMAVDRKAVLLARNMFVLGLVCWLYDRPLASIKRWLESKFHSKAQTMQLNMQALQCGFNYADTVELFEAAYAVAAAQSSSDRRRHLTGSEGLALGAIAASVRAQRPLFFASYPITPSSEVLHHLAVHKNFGVTTFQSEDEICAASAAIGAAYAGHLALCSTSGPGLDLKQEALGLAVVAELPLVIMDIQRAGPSTGMPTKTEQSDLLAARFGRHGECPIPIIAACSPGDCFDAIVEAFRIAVRYMTPVLLLSDGNIANSAEPWPAPDIDDLPEIAGAAAGLPTSGAIFHRHKETLARHWVAPGTPHLEHRIGGLARDYDSGQVSYEADNHHRMADMREDKMRLIQASLPAISEQQYPGGEVLVVCWGSTFGACTSAVQRLREEGRDVALLVVKHLYPFPRGLGETLRRYRTVIVPELNLGQLSFLLRAEYLVAIEAMRKVQGKPFKSVEIYQRCLQALGHHCSVVEAGGQL